MPRVGRVVLPNYPHHIVQRGHNRQVVFDSEDDCRPKPGNHWDGLSDLNRFSVAALQSASQSPDYRPVWSPSAQSPSHPRPPLR